MDETQWLYSGSPKRRRTVDAINHGVNYIVTFFAAFAIAMFLGFINRFDVGAGILAGLMIVVFWIATNRLNDVLYERKPLGLFILNVGYSLVTFIIMGAIIGAWY